jgi:tripartite-type tricarboxylate transporter receptor subunit TctC
MPSRLAMELFKAAAAVNIAPVASRDAGVTATESGDAMQVLFLPLGGALPQLKAGKLRALGAASARRVEVLPDLPTVAESGVPGFEASEWHGIVVPRGTERDIIARLYTEYIDILNLSDVRDPLLAQGFDIVANSPREFAAHIRAEIAKWATAVQRSGLKPD